MDERERELLAPYLKRTAEIGSVDRMFLDGAKKALASSGYGALDFSLRIRRCPRLNGHATEPRCVSYRSRDGDL